MTEHVYLFISLYVDNILSWLLKYVISFILYGGWFLPRYPYGTALL